MLTPIQRPEKIQSLDDPAPLTRFLSLKKFQIYSVFRIYKVSQKFEISLKTKNRTNTEQTH